MLGHTNVKTTQVYAKVVDEKKNKAANAIQIDIENDKNLIRQYNMDTKYF